MYSGLFKAQFFLVTFTLSNKNMVIQSQLNQTEATLNLITQCKRVTKVHVGHFFSIDHYLHSTNGKHLNFITGRINLQQVYPHVDRLLNSFHTFKMKPGYSQHLTHLKANIRNNMWLSLAMWKWLKYMWAYTNLLVFMQVYASMISLTGVCKNQERKPLTNLILFECWLGDLK